MLFKAGFLKAADAGGGSGFSDDFNRANETLETSADWTARSGDEGALSVVSNALRLTDHTTDSDARYDLVAAGAQLADSVCTMSVNFALGTGSFNNIFSFFPRFTDEDNWVRVNLVNNGEITIDERVAASENGLSFSDNSADMNGAGVANTLVITTSGTNVSVTINGNSGGSTSSAPLTSSTGKRIGINDFTDDYTIVDNLDIV